MKTGMLTSWDTQCGVAEYSAYIARAWPENEELVILGSRNYDERELGKADPGRAAVYNVFDVLPWNRYGHHGLDVEMILSQNFDALHIQYEVLLYHSGKLYELLSRFEGVKAITYHDNCIPPDFPHYLLDIRYAHRQDIGLGDIYVVPFGIENRPPVVKTFGLGRSRDDIIAGVCLRRGYQFAKSFGELDSWKSSDQLHAWLRDSDAIVLYYDEVPSAGSSQAARTAIATRRPVIVNDVTWFKDVTGTHKVSSPEDLEEKLAQILEDPIQAEIIQLSDWKNLTETFIKDYTAHA